MNTTEARVEIPTSDEKFTERQMLDYLHQRYSQTNPGNGPRYACAEHVKNNAGFYAQRCCDFIAIDCWPGNNGSGIELHGHEVKVGRSDWLMELKDSSKAEAFSRFMDRWWIVVPDARIIKPDELPDGWGLLTLTRYTSYGRWPDYHEPREDFRLRVKVQAERLAPEPLPRGMLATLMRSTARTSKRRAHAALCSDPCDHSARWFA